jgi:hypothetical protein
MLAALADPTVQAAIEQAMLPTRKALRRPVD